MVDPTPALHVYDRDIQDSERTSLSVLTGHIPAGARVLDLGCGSGAIGRFLAARDGTAAGPIDGLTISADEAALAAPTYRRVEVADLDAAHLPQLFAPAGYDAIACPYACSPPCPPRKPCYNSHPPCSRKMPPATPHWLCPAMCATK